VNSIRILWRRELKCWLLMPSYFLMGAVFLAVTGMTFWMFAVTMAGKGLLTSEITFSGMLFWMAFLAMASAVSVKLLGDDQERGMMELLLTAPVSELDIVLAKAGAGFQLILILALPAIVYPWILRLVFPDWHGVDAAMWLTGLLLVLLVAGMMTVCGMFWSLLFRRQTTAMVATFLTGVLIVFRGSLRSWIGGSAADASTGFVAVASHVASFAAGMVDSRSLVFYLTLMAVLLFINVRFLQLARYRRPLGNLNVTVSFILAWLLAGLINYLALLHPFRLDVSTLGREPLSGMAVKTLEKLTTPVRMILVAPLGEPLANSAFRVVGKYSHIHPSLEVQVVDQGRDLVKTRELVAQYKLRESYVVIVACGSRYRVLSLRAMERMGEGHLRPGQRGSPFSATLDAELLSALRSVSQEAPPAVYFLTGHDERGITDFSDYRGYSEIAGIIRERHADIRTLLLDNTAPVTNDCSVLVVAGPARSLAAWESAKLRDYLVRGGCLMLLLDSGHDTGLESFLEGWGDRIGQDRILDSRTTPLLPGSRERSWTMGAGEVPVVHYGTHPIVEGLDGLVSTFVLPRSVEPLSGGGGSRSLSDQVDKPRVTPLAYSSGQSWADMDFNQNPPQFNEGYDRHGPLSVAVCVEKGGASEITMDIKPIRMVVIGDSQFAANRCLAGGNEPLFMNALEWLLEREDHVAASPDQGGLYTLQIGSDRRSLTFLLIVVVPPGLLLTLMIVFLLARRDKRTPVLPRKGEPLP